MFDKIGALFGRPGKPKPVRSPLGEALRDYPPFTRPHLGVTHKSANRPLKLHNGTILTRTLPVLTLEQCQANLAFQLAETPRRLELVRELLHGFGVDTSDAYQDATRAAFLTALGTFFRTKVPGIFERRLVDDRGFGHSDYAGPDIAFSLLSDLGLLTSDMVLHARRGSFWGLNLDPGDREMASYRRPCVLGLSDRLFPDSWPSFCLADEWFGEYCLAGSTVGGFKTTEDRYAELLHRFVVSDDLPKRMATTWFKDAR